MADLPRFGGALKASVWLTTRKGGSSVSGDESSWCSSEFWVGNGASGGLVHFEKSVAVRFDDLDRRRVMVSGSHVVGD